jgi:PAS domain S-box-containing protein
MADTLSKDSLHQMDESPEMDYFSHPQLREAFFALEARYKKYFDASRDMRFVVAQDGRLIEVNQAGVEMFGYSSKEEMLQLKSIGALYGDEEDRALLQQKIEESGFVKDYLVEMQKKDGSIFLAGITANLWSEEDAAISYEGLIRDVSEYRKWQAALIESEKHNRRLLESVEYNRELNKYILQMLMLMSHDIRGPLVAMAATLKLLIRGSYGKMDVSVANTLKDLLSRVIHLLGFAEDCLGKAHSVEGAFKIQSEVLDLRQDIIDPVLDELSNDIQQQQIMIDNRLGAIPAGSIRVNVNRIWVKAVFRNLFRNAIKYGGKGCTIAFGFEDHGSWYRLNVYNSGEPIPEAHRDKLFTEFGRIASEGGKPPDGLGLGLYLIREIIRKHGGDIWYEAKPGGSDFVFTLTKEGT